ncbi:MbnH family di-heme enzyme [Ideonella sp. DXS29W]|uniref:MbnH family di-heme enzyme n=1 Tax=Ideonella lacteola TaxID=2984193 RepID=A0ABU9BWR9_9BURK
MSWHRFLRGLGAGACLAWLLTACGGGGTTVTDTSGADGDVTLDLPGHFPQPQAAADNRLTAAKVELGRFLFYERRLSGNGQQSCSSCHQQDKAFTDGLASSVGSTGMTHPRNAQSLGNVVYNATLTWAGPALVALESQMLVPIFGTDPVEMGVNDGNSEEVLGRLRADSGYVARFSQAFPEAVGGSEPLINWQRVVQSIASFQRTLITGRSKFDEYRAGRVQLTAQEERGRVLFFGEKAECFHCHGSFNFNDQVVHAGSRPGFIETPFHNTGLYNIDGRGAFPEPNRGLFETTFAPGDMGRFRAPSLRNVEVTGPYMHDGSIRTLEDVLDFYAAGGRLIASGPYAGDGRLNPFKSELVSRINLNSQEKADIVAFLRTLTDHAFLTDPRFSDPAAGR